jgi:hypothetical protein
MHNAEAGVATTLLLLMEGLSSVSAVGSVLDRDRVVRASVTGIQVSVHLQHRSRAMRLR